MEHPAEHSSTANHVESHWRTQLRNRIIQASSLLEILLSGLVLIAVQRRAARQMDAGPFVLRQRGGDPQLSGAQP